LEAEDNQHIVEISREETVGADTGHQQYRTFNSEKPQHYREQAQQTTAPTARC
jgi:hypothetical protein